MSSIVQSAVNGGPAKTRPRKLYRYKPVPPFAVDEDGYPCEDSMSQDTSHIAVFGYGLALKRHLKGRAVVHSDLSTHYAEGDRGAVIVPDLFVAFGGEDHSYRRSYKLWEDPPPEFVLEVLSKKTWRKDVGIKKDTYEFLGVLECWLYDPRVRWLDTPLEGYRLDGEVYKPIEPTAPGCFESEALGLDLHLLEGELRFFDPKAGAYVRTLDEEAEAADRAAEAAARSDEAAARSDEAAARSDEAAARLAEAAARSDEATARAQAEAAQARQEAAEANKRAAEAEREIAALRAKLAARESSP